MNKTQKRIIIISTIILIIVGVLMFSKRLRLLIGMSVPYTFVNGESVKLSLGSYGGKTGRIVNVMDANSDLIGNIYREGESIKYMTTSGVSTLSGEDKEFFSKLL